MARSWGFWKWLLRSKSVMVWISHSFEFVLMTWFSISSLIISYCGYVVSRDWKPPIMIRSMDTDRMATRHKSRFSLNSNSQVWHSKSKYYPSIFLNHTIMQVPKLCAELCIWVWFILYGPKWPIFVWMQPIFESKRPIMGRFRQKIGRFWLYPWI